MKVVEVGKEVYSCVAGNRYFGISAFAMQDSASPSDVGRGSPAPESALLIRGCGPRLGFAPGNRTTEFCCEFSRRFSRTEKF